MKAMNQGSSIAFSGDILITRPFKFSGMRPSGHASTSNNFNTFTSSCQLGPAVGKRNPLAIYCNFCYNIIHINLIAQAIMENSYGKKEKIIISG